MAVGDCPFADGVFVWRGTPAFEFFDEADASGVEVWWAGGSGWGSEGGDGESEKEGGDSED